MSIIIITLLILTLNSLVYSAPNGLKNLTDIHSDYNQITYNNNSDTSPYLFNPLKSLLSADELMIIDIYNSQFISKCLTEKFNLTKTKLRKKLLNDCSEGVTFKTMDIKNGVHKEQYKNNVRLIDDDNWKPSLELPKSTGSIDCDIKITPQDVLDVYINPQKCSCYTNYREAFTYRILIHNSLFMKCCLFFENPMEDPTLTLTERIDKTFTKSLKEALNSPFIDEIINKVILLKKQLQESPYFKHEILWTVLGKTISQLAISTETETDRILNALYFYFTQY